MITVWHMNGVMNAGGTESLIMNIFRFHGGDVNHVLVIHSAEKSEKGVYDNEIQQLGIKTLWLPSVGSVGIKKYSEYFRNLIEKEGQPDIIHSHLNAVGGVIAKVAKKHGIEHRIVHCHADIKYQGSSLAIFRSEIKLALMKVLVNKYATSFFACSYNAAKRLFYKPDRTVIINNAICVQNYYCTENKKNIQREKWGIDNDTLLVGAVGRIARIKNYEVILSAIRSLKKNGYKVKFICFGRSADDQYYEELKRIVIDYQIQNEVIFAGNSMAISDDIAALDVFVMPSITEGLGISALEAQAAGKMTLLSDGVPKETDMGLELVTYITPLESEQWANTIIGDVPESPTHDQIEKAFNEKGYNAITEVQFIENEYKKIVGE